MIGRFGRTARARARETALLFLLAGLMAAPGIATARTYLTDPPPYPEGDPTADDQPSPTPKKTSAVTTTSSTWATSASQAAPASKSVTTTRRLPYVAHMTWDLYLRILSRLIIR